MQRSESLAKSMAVLVLPMAMQNLFSALVSASDAVMLGAVSQSSLAAVSLAGQVAFVHSLFLAALMIGESTLSAQYWGKGDRVTVERVLALTTRYSAVVALCFSLAALLAPGTLMRLFTPDEALIALGARYLRVVSPSYLLSGVSQIYLCAMKNTGRVARSSVYATTPVLLNLALNALLIYGLPGLGIAGAALATTLSRTAEFLLVALENRRKDVVRLRVGAKRPRGLTEAYWRCTRPVMANEIVWGCGVTLYSVIMGHLGGDAVAANAIAAIVRNVIGCVAAGFGTGSGIVIGQSLGAGRLERARRDGGRIVRYALVIGAASGLVILCLSPLILRLSSTLRAASSPGTSPAALSPPGTPAACCAPSRGRTGAPISAGG